MPELSTLGGVIKTAYEEQADTNAFTDPEKGKLSGIEEQATKNSSDADLRDRGTHTGTQFAESIVDLPDLLSGKVDEVDGKSLTEANYTQEEKNKLAELEDAHLKGFHPSLQALIDSNPTPRAGDYGAVDDGVNILWHSWNTETSTWDARVGESTDILPAQVKQYYEDNPDTNAFTDNEKALLASFENRHAWSDKGTWNAAENTPTLLDGTGRPGDFYVVTTPGQRSFGSRLYNFELYDWVVFFRGTWIRFATNPKALTWDNILSKPDFGAMYAPKMPGPVSPAIPAVYAKLLAGQVHSDRSIVEVDWDNIFYDTFSLQSDNKTFVIPSWATRVRVTMSLSMAVNATGYRYGSVRRNGASVFDYREVPIDGHSSHVAVITPIFLVTPGDTITTAFWQNSGGDLGLNASSWLQIELYTDN